MRIEYENQVIDAIQAAIRRASREQKEIHQILLSDNEWTNLMRELKVRVGREDIDLDAVKSAGWMRLYGVKVKRWEGDY